MNGSRTSSPGFVPHSMSWRSTRSGFWVGWTGSLTRSRPAQIGASMKLCMSRCRPKFQVWPRSQHATISSQEFRNPARRSFGGGFVLCQTTNWNVSKAGSNASCQRPSRL